MIVSFYSYKGGVGRTQLCANVAAYLYYIKGKKVLLWDWDFEAPGLHYFFGLKNTDITKSGTLELLEEYMTLMSKNEKVVSHELSFISPEKNIINLLKSGNTLFKDAKVDLIAAGNYNNDFTRRSTNFDWFEFYSMTDGANYVELLKDFLKKNMDYDYVFIDSRTGISDYSGICNIQLPDINVIVIAPTLQNFDGSKSIIEKIKNAEYFKIKNKIPQILPVLSRLDYSNPNFNDWVKKFADYYSDLITNLDNKFDKEFLPEIFSDAYFKDTFLPYIPAISAGENVFFDSTGLYTKTDFTRPFINIAECLEDLNKFEYIDFYKSIDEKTWQEYASNAIASQKFKKAAIAYNQIGIKQENYREAKKYFQKSIEYAPDYKEPLLNLSKNRHEDFEEIDLQSIESNYKYIQSKTTGQSRGKRTYTLIFSIIIGCLGLIIALYTVFPGKKANLASSTDSSTLNDSLIESKAYLSFVTAYTTSTQQYDFNFNLEMIKRFYTLNPKYQDTLQNLKNQIEKTISYKFQYLVDSFYLAVRSNPSSIQYYLADTVEKFGKYQKVSKDKIQNDFVSYSKNTKITNKPIDSTFMFKSDTLGFISTFLDVGNVSIDKLQQYKSIKNYATILFDQNIKITSFDYNTFDSVNNKTVIEVFFCNTASESGFKAGNTIISALQANHSFSVYTKNNFVSSSDSSSPYFVTYNQIRYNGNDEYKIAQSIQRTIGEKTGMKFKLVNARTATSNYISIFLCGDNQSSLIRMPSEYFLLVCFVLL